MTLTRKTLGLLQAWLWATAVCFGGASPQWAHAYEDGWRTCAEEGQTCNVQGRAVVRFGADGRWVSRTVTDRVDCSNDAFGDPAPQVPKRCQVRVSGYGGGGGSGSGYTGGYRGNESGTSRGWSFCAAEGETCRFKGMAEVRFGQGDKFVTRTAYGSVRCDVADFGDPVYGATKFCEIRRPGNQDFENSTQGSWGGSGSSSTSGWRYCAAEGSTCRVQGSGQVRFGDGRNFRTRTMKGDVQCNTQTFGDPAYGRVKHCEVQANNFNDGNASGWSQCATEGERCNFSGTAQLRYGTAGRYVYRDGTNGVGCASNYFGNDPYPGRVKVCEIRR